MKCPTPPKTTTPATTHATMTNQLTLAGFELAVASADADPGVDVATNVDDAAAGLLIDFELATVSEMVAMLGPSRFDLKPAIIDEGSARLKFAFDLRCLLMLNLFVVSKFLQDFTYCVQTGIELLRQSL